MGPSAAQSATAGGLHLSHWIYTVFYVQIMYLLIQCFQHADILITGNDMNHDVNSSVDITCSSDLDVLFIRWLTNRELLSSNVGQQQLVLSIQEVTLQLNNNMYTCEVFVRLATGHGADAITKTITFRVTSRGY